MIVAILAFAGFIFSTVSYGQQLSINEFLARNDITVADQDGEFDDWIELYNYGSNTISLEGFSLSDDGSDPGEWVFPDTSIGSHSFLIVWTDDQPDQPGLHAEFKLSGSGEEIFLFDADENVIDDVTFGSQTTDISTGRFPDGTGTFTEMIPTFSAPNSIEEPPQSDISDTLFNTNIIHKYELRFYTDNWQDSLKYNYEVLDQAYMPAMLVYNNNIVRDSIGVRYKGNSSYIRSGATMKKPFKFKFDEYIDQTLFGVEKLNFSNSVSDPSFMREMIGYKVSAEYIPSPRAVYADIYVEGELIGLYIQVEQVDKLFLERHFNNNNNNLYKASDDGASLSYLGVDQSDYESEYELKTNEDENDWSEFIDLLEKLNNTPDDIFVETMSECLNIDGVISHLAFNMVLSSFDSYTGSGRNFYFYDDNDSDQFNIIPWDLNETFGSYPNNWNVITADIVYPSNINERPLMRRIMQNDSLRAVYFDRIEDMISGPASYDSIVTMVELYKSLIEEHVLADENKLYSSELFYDNIEEDVRISLGQVIPGIKTFSKARNENLLNQISDLEVFPGDCDNNGFVDALDILPIGIYFHARGSSREDVSFEWESNSVIPWYLKPATYADTNGDGLVDEKDVIGIGVNWGNSHNNSGSSFQVDLSDNKVIEQHIDAFNTLYNSLSGDNEAVAEMKSLLKSILYETNNSEPLEYLLSQNYPNPFNSSTMISFSLPETQVISLRVMNIAGQTVRNLIAKKLYQSGQHEFLLDASLLPAGVYIYRLSTPDRYQTRKLTVVK